MWNEPIQFKKQRDLGTIISDVFKFLRENWKPLSGLVFKIAGPALLILLAAYVVYVKTAIVGFQNIFDVQNGGLGTFSGTPFLALLILVLAAAAFYSLLNGTILHYIKSYNENAGKVSTDEVIAGVKEDFWSLLGLTFIITIITAFGLVLCAIPGIYLGVVLATTYSILIFEKQNAMDAVSYSFSLIKNEWWSTFGTLIVVFLLYYFIAMIFQIPQYIYLFIKGFTQNEEIAADPTLFIDWIYIALTSVGMLFQYLLYSIIVISTAFVYFNLNEKKNFTGTMEAIDEIGGGQ